MSDEEVNDEAEQILLNEDDMEDEGIEGEELINDDMYRDYEARPELDVYDIAELDQREFDEMTPAQRRAAEREIKQRKRLEREEQMREEGFRPRMPQALMSSDEESDGEIARAPRKRPRFREPEPAPVLAGVGLAALDVQAEVNLEERKGPLRDWLRQDGTRRTVALRFRNFLGTYGPRDKPLYRERISAMAQANGESLEVSYLHLSEQEPLLAVWLADAPAEILPIFDEIAYKATLEMFPYYGRIAPQVCVRVRDLPIVDSLRDMRYVHLNQLVRVTGVVTRRTAVQPQLKKVAFDCHHCGAILGPYPHIPENPPKLAACPQCQGSGPFAVNTLRTLYGNYQRLTLQESPGTVPPGRLPRTKEIVVTGDLIDAARPGEEVDVTGIYRHAYDSALNTQHGFPVFATVIDANSIARKEDTFAAFRLTEDDERRIRELGRDPRIGRRIIRSLAPSIYGHEDVKLALALALFGGSPKQYEGHRMRGDINVLVLGDPGTAKSQFLKYVERTASRAVYTTGQGASAVGLTAAVRKDRVTREWTLEGGALVLADNGVCLIDEFDKMNDQDRTSIHEAMEQQTISISKAGIVTTLQARCSVVAAANPVRGRYDPSLPFAQNVQLGDPILSRFDVLCVLRDTINPIQDERLAQFVVQSHSRAHPDAPPPPPPKAGEELDQETLCKYIVYARQRCHPRLADEAHKGQLMKLYGEVRQASKAGGGNKVTLRFVESMIRLAEAHARMHLRDFVTSDDVAMAVRVALESFIVNLTASSGSQKYSVARTLRVKFKRYLAFRRDDNELLFYVLQTLAREHSDLYVARTGREPQQLRITRDEFEARAHELGVADLSAFYSSDLFRENRFTVDDRTIIKAFG